jgi:hypothetical protein
MPIPPAPQNREVLAGAIFPDRLGRLSLDGPRPPFKRWHICIRIFPHAY